MKYFDALDLLIDNILSQIKLNNGPVLILIGGCSRSGKTTLVSMLKEAFAHQGIRPAVVSLDAWLVSLEKRKSNSTVIERYETERITEAVRALLRGEAVYPPVYDVVSRRRASEQGDECIQVTKGVIIVDGVIALAIESLLPLAAVKIYVNTIDEVRKERVRQFYTELKGLSYRESEQIMTCRESEEVPLIKGTKKNADIIYEHKHI